MSGELRSIALNTAPETSKESDPFDPAAIRLDQDFRGGKRVPLKVPVRKPMAQAFVRVRPGPEWRIDTAILEDKNEQRRELYLVSKSMREELASECYAATLFTTITRQNNLFLWPVRLPDPGGRDIDFWATAREAARRAETQWLRVAANMQLGVYDVIIAEGQFSEPEWPDLTFHEILKLAFKTAMIDSPDHPMVQALYGR